MKDALNQEIVYGQTYGYSVSQSSRINVVVGKAVKETPGGKVSLEVISRRHYVYGEEYVPTWAVDKEAKLVTVHPCHLFPVTLS